MNAPTPSHRNSPGFRGFPEGKVRFTRLPAPFFTELLPQIDDLTELKVSLYALWFLEQLEGAFRFVRLSDFVQDNVFMQGLPDGQPALERGLAGAVSRGTLLKAQLDGESEEYYFLNSPRGRAAISALQKGSWRPTDVERQPVALEMERPNIFRLYEEHIGPLTPMIAETLKEAEDTYPAEWIEDAVRIAVENNVRRWRYIQAILRKWQEEGRDDTDRRDTQENRRRYDDWLPH